jgi:hypothetical protein
MVAVLILSVTGLMLNLAGITCAGVALRKTWKVGEGKSDQGPMFPRLRDRRRRVSLWVWQRLGRRRDATVSPGGIHASAVVGQATVTATSGPINAGDPLDVQIKVLDHRIGIVERSVADERTERGREVRHLRRDTRRHFERLESEDAELREFARRLTLGTVRLQMIGVLLLGAGTVVGLIPVLCGG